jgi:hypothetical protein
LGSSLFSLHPKRGLQTGLVDIYPDRLGMVRDPNCPSHSPKTTVPLSGLLTAGSSGAVSRSANLAFATALKEPVRVLLKIGSILLAAIALLDRFPESNFRWTGRTKLHNRDIAQLGVVIRHQAPRRTSGFRTNLSVHPATDRKRRSVRVNKVKLSKSQYL